MPDQDIEGLWAKTTEQLKRDSQTPLLGSWMREVEPLSFHDGVLLLSVPSEFARQWLSSRYGSVLKRALAAVTGQSVDVRLEIHRQRAAAAGGAALAESAFAAPSTPVAAGAFKAAPPAVVPAEAPTDARPSPYQERLNPKYVFETFVVGSSNRFAHAASMAVAEMPSRAYNPLFIYGGVGLGKTHLMHAIGHRVLQEHADWRVLYVSSETFTNELITSIQEGRQVQFRQRYRNIDVLLIDDIQFVAGKESTQEEFFHTFEALYGARKQIIISSDKAPRDIPTLEERLRSRFEWGLISDIQVPDLETRIAILAKKAQQEGLSVPDDILQFIASRVDTNIRELEGALIRVIAYASITRAALNLDLAHEALQHVVALHKPRPITIRAIQEEVARHYDLKPDDFTSKRRTRSVAFPRQVAMYLARELTDASLPKIGEEFGGRDHTTVMHAHAKIHQDRQRDPHLNHLLEELGRRIKSR
jgi:chromosomal replication initiator protein